MNIIDTFKSVTGQPYKATLKVLSDSYIAHGESAIDAISKLVAKNPKGKGILTVELGDIKREKILSPVMLARLVSPSRMVREITIKNVKLLFDF